VRRGIEEARRERRSGARRFGNGLSRGGERKALRDAGLTGISAGAIFVALIRSGQKPSWGAAKNATPAGFGPLSRAVHAGCGKR
jgi:hypothetical protein